MASPLRMKAKWPSEKKKAGTNVTDFVPYASNLVNMFRKAPRPMAPKTIDPVTGTTISLADAKRQVADTTRAADLSTEGLDAQTGAAIRVGNLGNKFRSLSELNSKEAQINAQMGNQTKMVNANIDAQNSNIINSYHDDITNSQIAQQREQSENLANMSDKFIQQQTVKDQRALDLKKTQILSKMYNPGVYSRLMDSINGKKPGMFDKYKNMDLPNATAATSTTPAPTGVATASKLPPGATMQTPYPGTGPLTSDADSDSLPPFMRRKTAPQYFVNKFAAGGMMKVFGGDSEDPKPKIATVAKSVGEGANPNSMIFVDQTTRNTRLADLFNSVIAKGHNPITSTEGRSAVNEAKQYFNPQFATDFTARTLQLQGEQGYQTMTPEQRIQRSYTVGKTGTSELDKFLQETSSYGGNPGAFYQRSPYKRYGGKIYKPFA